MLDEAKASFAESLQAEMAAKLNEANATAAGALKDELYEEYEKKLAGMTVKTKQHFQEVSDRQLKKQREEFEIELGEARAQANAESIETVRGELEGKLQLAQAAAEAERATAVLAAQAASEEKMRAEKEAAVTSVMAASEAERMKAVEDALSRAEEEKMAQIKEVLAQAEAAKNAVIANVQNKLEREKAEAADELAQQHAATVKTIKEENVKKLSELIEQMEADAISEWGITCGRGRIHSIDGGSLPVLVTTSSPHRFSVGARRGDRGHTERDGRRENRGRGRGERGGGQEDPAGGAGP